MCCIVKSSSGRPKPEHLKNAHSKNSDGIGVAWRQDGYLQYEKGLTLEEAVEKAEILPLGFVMHFRTASAGGKDPALTHPFPIRLDSPLKQKGKANKLLFHNGHWSNWESVLLNHLSCRTPLPPGPFSDTRALAFLVAIHGKGFLNIVQGGIGYHKFVLMTPTCTTLLGKWEEENGVQYSNTDYKWPSYTSSYHDRTQTNEERSYTHFNGE